jgi:hypothetical protein
LFSVFAEENAIESSLFKFKTFLVKQPQAGICDSIVEKDTFVLLDFIQSCINALAGTIGPV